MPPEPKRPIEELLEATARERRAQFGVEPKMPNPMRAQLHEEIARLGRVEEPKRRRSWLAIFWPQISIATAVAAVLVTAAVVGTGNKSEPRSKEMQLAMNAPAEQTRDATSVLKSLETSPQIATNTVPQPAAEAVDVLNAAA